MAKATESTVKIPLSLLDQTIYLLENINPHYFPDYDKTIVWDYDNVMSAFLKKKQSLDLRQTYAKIICAKDDDERFAARMRYLQEKQQIHDNY